MIGALWLTVAIAHESERRSETFVEYTSLCKKTRNPHNAEMILKCSETLRVMKTSSTPV